MSAADELAVGDELKVAAVAAGCTVALTLALKYGLSLSVSYVVRLGPLYPYFVYLFASKSAEDSPLSSVRAWSLLIGLVSVGILVFYAL